MEAEGPLEPGAGRLGDVPGPAFFVFFCVLATFSVCLFLHVLVVCVNMVCPASKFCVNMSVLGVFDLSVTVRRVPFSWWRRARCLAAA